MVEIKLIDYVRKNYEIGLLRDVIGNFFVMESALTLPKDNNECRDAIIKAMDLYFKLKNLDEQ